MAGDYHIENIYGGGYSSMDPNKGELFTGYRIPAGSIGLATDARTANMIQEVSQKLQTGAKHIEVTSLQPEIFDSMPKQHLKEINRIAKLAGAEISVHGIIAEPSGVNSQQGYSEIAREQAERQMLSNVLRAHEMSPDGNVPITFHSSAGFPSTEYREIEEEGKKVFKPWKTPIINQETGQVNVVQAETLHYPRPNKTWKEIEKGELKTALQRIEIQNETQWDNSLTALVAIKERADRAIHETEPYAAPIIGKKGENESFNDFFNRLNSAEQDIILRYQNAGKELEDIHLHLSSLFDQAFKYGKIEGVENGKEEYRKELLKISEKFKENLVGPGGLSNNSRAMGVLMQDLGELRAPEVFMPVEEFASEKASETFGNVAFGAYKKFKDKSPIISIENPPAGIFGLSRAEDLKKIVEEARNKFVENAMKSPDQGGLSMSKSEAERQAEKLIGVTWDVGHINMIRKQGFGEKEVIKETEKIAPFVKHVHLSDNFGMEHTELPMGMGNVPIKKMMEKLGKKGFEAKKVVEALNWWQHFKTPPLQETFEAFGSPIYGMKMAPYWNQSIGNVGYFGGYGNMLPQINYETMGAGFSMLPSELGGQRGGTQGSRMSGRGME